MEGQDPKDDKNERSPRKHPKLTKKSLDHFLSSLCEAAGMSGKPSHPEASGAKGEGQPPVCQGPCAKAEWRAHLDIPGGILCVSAAWSANRRPEKHRDITIAITYLDEKGRTDYADMVFCDSEIRWLMESLWHAPIWD